MNSAANDNASAAITSIGIFAVGRSGRRVALSRGVSFGIELQWSTGAVTALAATFPAMHAAASHAARAYRVGQKANMIAL